MKNNNENLSNSVYELWNNCNISLGIATLDFKKAINSARQLNRIAKKENSGMRFYVKTITLNDFEFNRVIEWYKKLIS